MSKRGRERGGEEDADNVSQTQTEKLQGKREGKRERKQLQQGWKWSREGAGLRREHPESWVTRNTVRLWPLIILSILAASMWWSALCVCVCLCVFRPCASCWFPWLQAGALLASPRALKLNPLCSVINYNALQTTPPMGNTGGGRKQEWDKENGWCWREEGV